MHLNRVFSRRSAAHFLFFLLSARFWVSPSAAQLANTCSTPGQSIVNVPGDYQTIQAAINASSNGTCILVAPGIYRENLVLDGAIRDSYLELKAAHPDPAQTIIDGGQLASVVVFQHVPYNPAIAFVPAARISGFTIQNGLSQEGQGGGITLANQADVIVENNIIRSNTGGTDGGGILVFNRSHAIIRNNIITGNQAPRFGGGILVVGDAGRTQSGASHPLIFHNTITNNRTSGYTIPNGGASGGGIFVDAYSSPRIILNTITGNSAPFAGGAIALLTGNSSIIEDNIISSNSSSYGGGIHIETNGGSPTVRNNNIYNNTATSDASFSGSGFGGGISVYAYSAPTISQNIISANTATYGGGGIVIAEGSNAEVKANAIHSNRLSGSPAGSPIGPPPGGGIFISQATANVVNNLIYDNSAGYGGGVGLIGGGTLPTNAIINSNTIVRNTATVIPGSATGRGGGGLFVHMNANCTPATNTTVLNNIFESNIGFQIFEACKGGATYTTNLVNNFSDGMYFNYYSHTVTSISVFNASVSGSGNISGGAFFADPANNNFRLTAGSAAIDAGTSVGAPEKDCSNTERPLGVGHDLGAYEFAPLASAISPTYKPGLYDTATGLWYLRNSNGMGVALSYQYGPAGAGWIAFMGDWNGDGIDTPGLYAPATGTWYLRNSHTTGPADLTFQYGPAGLGWIPVVGDWNGDGTTTVGLYDPAASIWYLRNSNTTGFADITFQYGPGGLGWLPLVGDWNGDGRDTIGLFNPATSAWYLRDSSSSGFADLTFQYGPAGLGWIPVVGDWNGDGTMTVGVFDPANAQWYQRNSNSTGYAENVFFYGPQIATFKPVVGIR